MRHLTIIIVLLCLASCQKSKLETALEFAGDNRVELEKVLSHYGRNEEDHLKLRAARYLIENMPGHVYYDDSATNGYFTKIDSLYADRPFYIKHALYNLPGFVLASNEMQKEDIHHITADYLIRHIDRSFDLWLGTPWAEEVPFDVFRDNILPYRVGYEPLDRLMTFDERIDTELFEKMTRGNNMNFASSYFEYISNLYSLNGSDHNRFSNDKYDTPAPFAKNGYKFECVSIANVYKWMFNYAGIPAAIDYAPAWSKTNDSHQWISLIDPHFKKQAYRHITNRYIGKVYRKTYHSNEIPTDNGLEYIPPFFRDPFYEDVTDLYVYTKDINIGMRDKKGVKPDYAYLCVFNSLEWRPIAWGKLKGWKVGFNDIATTNIYLPIYYDGTHLRNLNYPFSLSASGEIRFMVPSEEKVTLRLNRKYTTNPKAVMMSKTMIGLDIVGIKDKTGTEEVLYTLSESDINNAPLYNIKLPQGKYRYIKLVNKSEFDAPPAIAEITFFDLHNKPCDVREVISDANYSSQSAAKLFDNDKLTSLAVQSYMTFDFGKDVELGDINLLTWTDDNYVVAGETYELFYHDAQGWVSVGRQVARHDYVEFADVPGNALYWLRNRTKGVEERPFTYENGKIVFW